MTRSDNLTTINCTACGAGLDVLGGGRVTVHICPYCGTELDALDSYKALRTFSDLKRPDTPFSLGMKGKIHDVDYTIIGTLEHTETYAGRTWTWIDHQLYSPTHGYAFLTLEDGHFIFSRRYRGPGWVSEHQVEKAETPPVLRIKGENFKYYDTSTSSVSFAEGEFTWEVKIGDKSTTVSTLAEDAMLGFSQTKSERETYRSTYLPRKEIAKSFGIDLPKLTKKIHPLSPFKAGPNAIFMRKAAAGFAVLCMVIAFVFGLSSGKAVMTEIGLPVAGLPVEIPFEVTQANKLVEIALAADVSNSWASIGLTVSDPEGEILFGAGRTIERYHGQDSEGRWTEGSGKANLRFHPTVAGTYQLNLGEAEGGVWAEAAYKPKTAISKLDLRIREGQTSGTLLFLLGLVFGVVALWQFYRRWRHQSKRWAGGDWND
ncbi:MAG: DUF4178 domain-containing protein [Pelagimonas sp.]|uniref:DUF4178 domain-containing protein n=1 Tax=Pelagimonas sp. TaxID=2073170 RepID=UPI003D6B265D